MDTRFDDILNTVITEKGQGIYGFIDVFFSFLYRRTDFFYEMAPGENMGFFPTQAEAIVCGYFRKYQQLHYKERVPKRNIDPKIIQEYLEKQKKEKLQQKETPKNVPSKKPSEPTSSIKSTETVTKTTDTNNNKQLDSASTVQAKKPVENKPIAISTYNGDFRISVKLDDNLYDINGSELINGNDIECKLLSINTLNEL